MKFRPLFAASLWAGSALIGTSAMAQAAPAPSKPADQSETGQVRAPTARSLPPSVRNDLPKPQVQAPATSGTPVGPLAGLGRSLADRGIYLRLLAVDEFAGSVSGGQGRGTGNSYALPFGVDLDLDRLVGWRGAAIHYSMNMSKGTSLAAEHTGNAISFQTRYKTYQNLRLAALAFEQNLLDGKITISGGRVAPLTYFNQSNIYCTFQSNAICFNPAVVPIQDRALGFFPYNTWGGRIKVAPSRRVYAQIGIFEANTALLPTNGFDWSTKQSTGQQFAFELGFQSPDAKAPHAYHLRVGGYANNSDVSDPYLNTRGLPRIGVGAAGGTALIHGGQDGLYAMGDVAATHMAGDPKRPVTLFGGYITSTTNYVPFKAQALLGVIVTGPFRNRPADTIGLVGSYVRIGSRQREFLQASRALVGGTDRVLPAEGLFELNYGIAAMRGVRISPNVQYIISPDNFLLPRARSRSGNILAFGLRVSIDAAAILGLPAQR